MVGRKPVRFDNDRISLDIETRTFNFSVDKIVKCHLIEGVLVKLEPNRVWLTTRDFLGNLSRSQVSTSTVVLEIGSTPMAETRNKIAHCQCPILAFKN
jgi:hypothetical protein